MKKYVLFTILSIFSLQFAMAQDMATPAGKKTQININLYGAYVFDDKFDSYYDYYNYYNGKIKGGFQYGAGIEFMPNPTIGIELLYFGQSTTAPTYYYSTGFFKERYSTFDLNLSYVMLGGTRHVTNPSGKFEGYGGFMLGALFASAENPENGSSGSATKFAFGLKLGGNIWMSEKVGFKLNAQILSAAQSIGGSLYFGTGGAGAGITTYSSMIQFSIGGGLVFALGK
jgi:hypothetical protein